MGGGVRPGGELLWKSMTEGYYSSSPAIVDGVVYACGIYDINAIDAFTGKLLWTSPYGGGRSSPAVTNGRVYTVSADRNVSALDQATGSLLWEYGTGGWSIPARQCQTGSSTPGAKTRKCMHLMRVPGLFYGVMPLKTA